MANDELSNEQLRTLLRAASRERAERKLDFDSPTSDNVSQRGTRMTKTAMLAQALRGKVVEDQGYRGVVYVDDRNEFVRFHSMYGVHQVSRRAKTWRVVRSILTAEEVEPYLREAGVLPDINAAVNVMDSMATQLNGEVIARFSSGGGVVKCEFGFIRFSNITGLDKVELVITKWRSVRKLMGRTEALHNIITHKLGDAVRALFDTSLGETA